MDNLEDRILKILYNTDYLYRPVLPEDFVRAGFKAGVREVLKEINYQPNLHTFYVKPEKWSSKLKEWEIE